MLNSVRFRNKPASYAYLSHQRDRAGHRILMENVPASNPIDVLRNTNMHLQEEAIKKQRQKEEKEMSKERERKIIMEMLEKELYNEEDSEEEEKEEKKEN